MSEVLERPFDYIGSHPKAHFVDSNSRGGKKLMLVVDIHLLLVKLTGVLAEVNEGGVTTFSSSTRLLEVSAI